MTALPTASPAPDTATTRAASRAAIAFVRAILLTEAALTLALAVFFSLLASEARSFLGGTTGEAAETTLRFAAAAAFIFAIAAAIASRGVRRRRTWSWTTAAVLQLLLAIGTAVAVFTADWHPAYLIGFALATIGMTALCLPAVRRELGQV
jgi:peptidoglycan/LPS O-acetylase OafA/YrhL